QPAGWTSRPVFLCNVSVQRPGNRAGRQPEICQVQTNNATMPIDATTKLPLRPSRHAVAILQTVFKRLWPASRIMLALVSTTIIALCAYIALTAVVYVAQRSLMYFPDTAHVLPAAAGLPEAEEVPLTAGDGVRIAAWHVPPREGKTVILYFHGNGGGPRFLGTRLFAPLAAGSGAVGVGEGGAGLGRWGRKPKRKGSCCGGGGVLSFRARPLPAATVSAMG